MAGLPLSRINDGIIIQARERTRNELRGSVAITKEDVVFGMREAIHRAQLIAEPSTEIRGWEAIAKLLGFDSAQKIDINVRESVTVIQRQVRELPDTRLVELLGAGNVLDADFYEVKRGV